MGGRGRMAESSKLKAERRGQKTEFGSGEHSAEGQRHRAEAIIKNLPIFLSQWMMLKQGSLEYPRLYDHWILGQDAVPKQPRWSIIRDVLQWVQ